MSVLTDGWGRRTPESSGFLSPFGDAPMSLLAEPPSTGETGDSWRENSLNSPFAEALTSATDASAEVEVLTEVLDHLADEDFRRRAGGSRRPGCRQASGRPGQLVGAPDQRGGVRPARRVAGAGGRFSRAGNRRNPGDARERRSHLLRRPRTRRAARQHPISAGRRGFDQFLGGLIKKAKQAVTGAVSLAKKGLALAGKLNPVNLLLSKLKGLVRPLLTRVLGTAIAKLPEDIRPIAKTVASKLGVQLKEAAAEPVSRLADDFDAEIAALLLHRSRPDGGLSTRRRPS